MNNVTMSLLFLHSITEYSSPSFIMLFYFNLMNYLYYIFWEIFPLGMDILSLESFQQKEKRKKNRNFHISTFFKLLLGLGHNYPHSAIASQLLAEWWKSVVLSSDVRASLGRRKKESVSKEQEWEAEITRWGPS